MIKYVSARNTEGVYKNLRTEIKNVCILHAWPVSSTDHFNISHTQKKERQKTTTMTYPFIPIGLIAVFIVYILYLLFIKKDMKKLKIALYPGLFFIAVWAVVYYFLLK